jgi:hypothetical protein
MCPLFGLPVPHLLTLMLPTKNLSVTSILLLFSITERALRYEIFENHSIPEIQPSY